MRETPSWGSASGTSLADQRQRVALGTAVRGEIDRGVHVRLLSCRWKLSCSRRLGQTVRRRSSMCSPAIPFPSRSPPLRRPPTLLRPHHPSRLCIALLRIHYSTPPPGYT